jgi:signal transduction histidine kinase
VTTFLNTFRGRLLLILAFLLIATLGVQYYLNLSTQEENNEIRERQEQILVDGIALGFNSITSQEYLQDLVARGAGDLFDEQTTHRIRDIIIIDNQWRIYDSLNPDHLPTTNDAGETVYKPLSELTNLPPIAQEERLAEDLAHFPNRRKAEADKGAGEAHALPIQTSQGRWYVMVVLESKKGEAAWRAAQPLVYTLGILLASSVITFFLVWRFTRPVANLSAAAREIAEGNLNVRVPDADRRDEMGELAQNFNEMAAQLEKKRDLESQLQQAEKSAVVGRLGSAIAHEIRNPLNYINLTLDHLRAKFAPEDGDKKAKFDKLTSQLKAEVARINQQISDFLNYSRPAKADLRPVTARDCISESLRIVEPEAAEKNVTISVIEHEGVPRVMGDPEFLRSVFNNLFINAVQAMETRGGGHLNIKISPAPDDASVIFEVADTGEGISEDNLAKIFEPYFSTKETGTGLGLAIVQKIVDIHHGSVTVRPEEGKGTTFTVKLPAAVEGGSSEHGVEIQL